MIKILLILFIFGFFYSSIAQKEITVSFQNLQIKKTNVWLFNSINDDYNNNINSRLKDKSRNELKITNWDHDTLIIQFTGMVPYLFVNLKSLDSNKIEISNLTLTKYSPIDTLSTYSVKYKRDSTLNKKSEKTKTITPNNSLKFKYSKISININGILYTTELVKSNNDYTRWYCTKYKNALSYDNKGIRFFYQINIQPIKL